VSTEPKSVCLQFDPDPRFAAGAGGVAKFFAENSGLEGDAPQQLQAAVTAACLEVFEQHPSDRPLSVTFTRHADRIEVALSREGQSAPGAANRAASDAIGWSRRNGVKLWIDECLSPTLVEQANRRGLGNL